MNLYHAKIQAQAEAIPALEFDFECHEDLAALATMVRAKGIITPEETSAFVAGLKIFSGVLLKHRHEPLFVDFAPHFGELMKKLKSA